MSEMLRRVANAVEPGVFDEPHCKCVDCQRASASHQEAALAVARRVLQAVREPTNNMVNVGETAFFDSNYQEVQSCWVKMIDEALK